MDISMQAHFPWYTYSKVTHTLGHILDTAKIRQHDYNIYCRLKEEESNYYIYYELRAADANTFISFHKIIYTIQYVLPYASSPWHT